MTIACTLAMTTYVSITFVYLEHIDFFVLFLGVLCVGIITISINLYLLVSTYVDACVYILHQILCYYCHLCGCLVVLVLSHLELPEDLHGHKMYLLYSFNVDNIFNVVFLDRNRVIFYQLLCF